MEATQLRASDPLRPANWRFRTALDHVERGLRLSRREHDIWVCRCEEFLRRRQRCRTRRELARLCDVAPHLQRAIQIFEAPQKRLRYVLEARVLAGDSVTAIASTMGISVDVVSWYLSLFFDVLDRIASPDLILSQVIVSALSRSYDWCDLGWKVVDFFAGRAALNEILVSDPKSGLDGLLHTLGLEKRLILALKSKLSAEQVKSVDNRAMLDMMRLVASGNGNTQEVVEPESGLVAGLQACIESLPFQTVYKSEQVPEFERGAVEARSEELMRMHVGETVREFEAAKDLQFPQLGEPGRQEGSITDPAKT